STWPNRTAAILAGVVVHDLPSGRRAYPVEREPARLLRFATAGKHEAPGHERHVGGKHADRDLLGTQLLLRLPIAEVAPAERLLDRRHSLAGSLLRHRGDARVVNRKMPLQAPSVPGVRGGVQGGEYLGLVARRLWRRARRQ